MQVKLALKTFFVYFFATQLSHPTSAQPLIPYLHCKKELAIFPSPAGMSLTKLSLGGKKLNYSRPGRIRSVTSRLGTGKRPTLFHSVATHPFNYYQNLGIIFDVVPKQLFNLKVSKTTVQNILLCVYRLDHLRKLQGFLHSSPTTILSLLIECRHSDELPRRNGFSRIHFWLVGVQESSLQHHVQVSWVLLYITVHHKAEHQITVQWAFQNRSRERMVLFLNCCLYCSELI